MMETLVDDGNGSYAYADDLDQKLLCKPFFAVGSQGIKLTLLAASDL